MIYYMNLISIVIAVSLDGFGVGVSYGMRKIRMPLAPIVIIMICSGTIVVLAMTIGNYISQFLSPQITHIIGSILLILIGCFVLTSIIRMRIRNDVPSTPQKQRNQFEYFKS